MKIALLALCAVFLASCSGGQADNDPDPGPAQTTVTHPIP